MGKAKRAAGHGSEPADTKLTNRQNYAKTVNQRLGGHTPAAMLPFKDEEVIAARKTMANLIRMVRDTCSSDAASTADAQHLIADLARSPAST